MTRSTTRWALAGCAALAALAATAVFDVGSRAADAAPSVSPFAGTYVGADPRGMRNDWAVTITDAGRITSSYSYPGSNGSISGRVGADGSYSFTVSVTFPRYRDRRGHIDEHKYTVSYDSVGIMTTDADGNVVGTADTGESFVWLRQ